MSNPIHLCAPHAVEFVKTIPEDESGPGWLRQMGYGSIDTPCIGSSTMKHIACSGWAHPFEIYDRSRSNAETVMR